jgi:hypothetical protein
MKRAVLFLITMLGLLASVTIAASWQQSLIEKNRR